MLLVVLQAAMMLVHERLMGIFELSQTQNAQLPFGVVFALGMGLTFIAVIWQMMYLGFLKTAALEGSRSCLPMDLVRCGRPYFWRIIGFQVILFFAMFILLNIVVAVVALLLGYKDPISEFPPWLLSLCGLIPSLLLLKPLLFVTARIIVYEETVWQSIQNFNRYVLREMQSVVRFLVSGMAVLLIVIGAGFWIPEKTIAYYLYTGLHNVIFSLFLLIPTLAVVLWIERHRQAELQKISEDVQE